MKEKLFVLCLFMLFVSPVFAQCPNASPADVGVDVLIPERLMFDNDIDNLGNWEPYTSAFGDGTLALAANSESNPPQENTERVVVAFFNNDNSVVEVPGFYSGVNPAVSWDGNNDTNRQNGNPPRIACDKRPGATKYLVGNECTPWDFPALFPNWGSGFGYAATVGCTQLLQKSGNTPVPISPVIDPTYGTATSGSQIGHIRFGGEIRALSNGNFICVVEDRSGEFPGATGNVPVGSILDGNTGQKIGDSFSTNLTDPSFGDIWSGVAAFNGGFAVKPDMGASGNKIFFWNNAGTAQGEWERIVRMDPNDPLPPANGNTSSISQGGRGDGFRIDSDIRSNYIYFAGRGIDATGTGEAGVYVTKISAQTRQTVKEAYVTQEFTAQPDRVNVCADENDNVFVCWNDSSNTGMPQVIGRFYDSNLDPLTECFLVFESSEANPGEVVDGFTVNAPSCAMINGRVLVTARVSDNAVVGTKYVGQDQIATVLKVPGQSSVKNWDKY
ncbi:MAG: hypothetical protein H3C63_11045 [Candidatus Omnitrophica bacterium]|nr:hypothetical protein [Candidatus Omnitrophota bacterium]